MRKFRWVLLVLCILIPVSILLHDCAVARKRSSEAETATGWQDQTDMLADYICTIFGKYRLNRGNSKVQSIYYERTPQLSGLPENVVLASGTIEKYMHDSKRYIAYHITQQNTVENRRVPGDAYYAILDTQTETTERFADIEALSEAVRTRGLEFGNWYYTYARNSVEGIRTPLVGEYSFEYVSNIHGQGVLLREVPLFFGVLDSVQTDAVRYIAFRQRIIHNDTKPWYADPITNALLSSPSESRIGLYRKSFLIWYSVYYDRYVLFDTQENAVQEFSSKKEIQKHCTQNEISLQDVAVQKS